MTKVILFDLDGTLLPMDTDAFVKGYLKHLAPKVASIIAPEHFLKCLWAGTEAMMRNIEAEKTNEHVFEETFLELTKLKKEDIWPTLDDFYTNVFPTLSHLCSPTPLARQVVEEAVKQGYRIAVATNPVFPKAAIYERLRWAGIEDMPFEVVTFYENSSFTKPHAQYYQEICDRLEVEPSECLMVGNDKQEDMAASQIGMKTFLVEGYIIDRGEPSYPINEQGTLEQFYVSLMKRQGLFEK
ncbi:HAD family hydrolase [Anaerobacillus isosaccharinicus]|uniref:HAD family hydrolase n=1 Tax=Anaerobacillus isosaccharinicus TaxID=1532552 RepID=A0A1S2LJ38_9BACI|nr:HAD family hydrolase [Anaerobacillus isosaccharinicus]MBA5586093.1 HAD family hydrolase [Anaerobacillus isosaccharinicus]QOY35638.1 HAD family hydrolase [Anaerobacillus isosaccharinicus]